MDLTLQCTEEAHRPVDCGTVAKWILKNSAESENMNWYEEIMNLWSFYLSYTYIFFCFWREAGCDEQYNVLALNMVGESNQCWSNMALDLVSMHFFVSFLTKVTPCLPVLEPC